MGLEMIPAGKWSEFLTSFSDAHHGWLVNVHVRRPGEPPACCVHGLPLMGVFDDHERVIIAAGREPQHVDRVIDHPIAVRRAHTDEGVDAGLDIESADGEYVQLRFRSAIPPELVDGI